jgi:hypothetical protein
MSEEAQRRVWARLPDGARRAIAALSPTDLQTLLLAVARDRAASVRPADVLRRWREDRFVRPMRADPRALAALEARLWAALPLEFDAVELSPVVPLGTCTAVANVSQNRIVTTTRSVEVLSDSANALAVEAADRRLRQPAGGEVHLATCHRLLRAQRFPSGLSSHFRLFTLVSSARDTGTASTQARLLALHLGYWQKVLAGLAGEAQIRITYYHAAMRERCAETVRPTESIVEGPDRARWQGYYEDAAFVIVAGDTELGDGGVTTWTAQLMGNAKERCLVSCLSTERLLALTAPAP